MQPKDPTPRPTFAAAWLLVAGSALFWSPASARGARLVGQVDESFELAGSIYPAGPIAVRTLYDFSPTRSLHEIWVGNESIGVLVTTSGPMSGVARTDSFVFERGTDGHLVLIGVRIEDNNTTRTYRFPGTRPSPSLASARPPVAIAKR